MVAVAAGGMPVGEVTVLVMAGVPVMLLDGLRPLQRNDPPFAGEFVRARGWPGRR